MNNSLFSYLFDNSEGVNKTDETFRKQKILYKLISEKKSSLNS